MGGTLAGILLSAARFAVACNRMVLSRRAFGLGLVSSVALAGVGALSLANERQVLRAAIEAFYPPVDGLPRAAEIGAVAAVETYLEKLPAFVALQARGLFRSVEWLPVPVRGSRFSQLPVEARVAFLQSMSVSTLYPQRLAVHALKQICAVGYWQHDQTWSYLGYDGPLVSR